MRARVFAIGAALSAAYLVVTVMSWNAGLVPVRPLYEGSGPPRPYRWVDPPPELANGNEKPEPGQGDVEVSKASAGVNTGDFQATFSPAPKGFAPKAGETMVHVTLAPLDPNTVGPPLPGMSYDGNAVRIEAVYKNSGVPAVIPATTCPKNFTSDTNCPYVVMRYVYNAKDIYRRDGDAWVPLNATVAAQALTAYGFTNKTGIFVVMDQGKQRSSSGNFLAFAIGLGAVLLGTGLAAMRARRSGGKVRRRAKDRKRAPPKRGTR